LALSFFSTAAFAQSAVFQTALGHMPEIECWRRKTAAVENVPKIKVAAKETVFGKCPRCSSHRSLGQFPSLTIFFSRILSLAYLPTLFETERLKVAAKQKTAWSLKMFQDAATFDLCDIF